MNTPTLDSMPGLFPDCPIPRSEIVVFRTLFEVLNCRLGTTVVS